MTILLFFVCLAILVLSHEFGHFIVAKLVGIKVEEFGFGFPPRAWSRKYGETEYSINWIPFGGFVRMLGESPTETVSDSESARSFSGKSKLRRAAVIVAGVLFNLLLAWFLIALGLMSGLPTSTSSLPIGAEVRDVRLVVLDTFANSPATKGGLKAGDAITSMRVLGGENFVAPKPEKLQELVAASLGQSIEFSILRGEESMIISVVPEGAGKGGKPAIGISMDEVGMARLGFWGATVEGFRITYSIFENTVVGLSRFVAGIFVGQVSGVEVTGPIGIAGLVGTAYSFGWVYLGSLLALISVNLAVINMLPIPALDGGHILFLCVEALRGKPVSPETSEKINRWFFFALLLLMLLITVADIFKAFAD